MKIGMLWFNNDPKMSLEAKIAGALKYYKEKYGSDPNRCFVHPTTLKTEKVDIPGVEVLPTRSVMPNHFWVGIGDQDVSKRT